MRGTVSLSLVIFAGFFCSCLLILGFLTRLACNTIDLTMCAVVFYTGHGDVFDKGEIGTLYLTDYLALLFTGTVKITVDRLIGK